MVLFVLCIKADLDGVRSLSFTEDTNVCIDIRNPLSDYEVREKVVFNLNEQLEQEENSREPPCNFAIKWEGSKKRSVIEVLDAAAAKSAFKKLGKKANKHGAEFSEPREVKGDDSGDFVPILALECRGVEPYAFHPIGGEFVVISEGGAKFEDDVDFSEGDWADYDEENDIAVSITEFESKFISA